MHNQPLFSIAIPTYNRLALLKRAIDSALSQSYQNIEVSIFNNASTDGTDKWLETITKTDSRIKIINQRENLGLIGNVKTIPWQVNGKYLVVLSDDDFLDKEFATTAVNDLLPEPKATIWYCRTRVINDEGLIHITKSGIRSEEGERFVNESLVFKREAHWVSTVYDLATLRKIGGFIGNTFSLDYSSRCLCALQGLVVFNNQILSNYFISNISSSSSCGINGWMQAQEEIFLLLDQKIKIGPKVRVQYLIRIRESFLQNGGLISFLRDSFVYGAACRCYVLVAILKRAHYIAAKILLPNRWVKHLKKMRWVYRLLLQKL